MAYAELLRLRNALYWYCGIVAAVTLTVFVTLNWHAREIGSGSGDHNASLSGLVGIAAVCAAILATCLGATLNGQNENAAIAFTKPISREHLAALYVLSDLGSIVFAFVFTLALIYLVVVDAGFLAHIGTSIVHVNVSEAAAAGALGLGMGFMWYGLVQGATAWRRGGGGMAIGISWGLFIALLVAAYATRPGALHEIALVLNVINPLAYMTAIRISGQETSMASLFHTNIWTRAGIEWAFGVAGCAVATLGWKRLEV